MLRCNLGPPTQVVADLAEVGPVYDWYSGDMPSCSSNFYRQNRAMALLFTTKVASFVKHSNKEILTNIQIQDDNGRN